MATPINKNVTMTRGDTNTETYTILRSDNTVFDLTDMDIVSHIKRNKDTTQVLITRSISSGNIEVDIPTGVITITTTKEDTDTIGFSEDTLSLYYDIQISSADNTFIQTIVSGEFIIIKDITR